MKTIRDMKKHTAILFSILLPAVPFLAQPQPASNSTTMTAPVLEPQLLARIKSLAEAHHAWMVDIRRHLHRFPETGGNEKNTQAYIASKLDEAGVSYTLGIGGGYSVVARISGRNPGKRRIAFRADTDALPIQEKSAAPYCSQSAGVMHACGHDAHTANLLGFCRIMHELRDGFEGEIVAVFQPDEERLPGGAIQLINAGILDGVDKIIGLHCDPNLNCGTVGIRPGRFMASNDVLKVTIVGRGGHGGSSLHQTVDPIMTQAQLLLALAQIKTHNCDARTPMVLSFGHIEGGNAPNVIPDTVRIEGTFRTVDEAWRKKAKTRMKEIAAGVAMQTGATIDFQIEDGNPSLYNDPALAQAVREHAAGYLGHNNVADLDIWMASEDFARYGERVPACFFRVGVRNESRGITAGLHTKEFDIDEDALKVGAGLFAWIAVQEMGKE